ncbi:MAG: NAD(P)/FAD-dependent oxidoreductase [Deltaproteobacteria bacterium]|nr:NAD(P)/FAD-dependent oxidoreductase [Deltaproteobacteria bacterium]
MTRPDVPWSKRAPDGPWDAIVIGSGMGGMTCAAMLAQLGKRVLVLEQHYTAGGFTHTFARKQWTWDVGVHAVGEVSPRTMTGRLLSRLTDGQLAWASLGPVYDAFHFPDGVELDFPDSPQQFRANLIAAFPDEERAIDDYLHAVRQVAGAMKGYYLARTLPRAWAQIADRTLGRKAQAFLGERTADVLARLTSNPRLRAVFAAQWGYYGSVPSRSSFAMQALVVKHFLWGGFYPVGGAEQIARGLLGTVAKHGGWTRIRADVAEVLVERGRAVGVRMRDGEELRAPTVVSAIGARATVERLLPGSRGAAWSRSIAQLPAAPAHVCLYIGFKGDIRQAGASGANQWFYETWDTEVTGWDVSADGPVGDAPVLYCSFPSLKDPTHDPGPEQLHTGEVVTFVPWAAFERWKAQRWRNRDEDYQAFKQRLADALLKQLLRHMPGLAPHVAFTELSTPVTTDHFARPIDGSIYGLEPTVERFANQALRPRAPVPGLFFAGSEVTTVGVMGAMMGGVLAAVAAEPIGAMRQVLAASRG